MIFLKVAKLQRLFFSPKNLYHTRFHNSINLYLIISIFLPNVMNNFIFISRIPEELYVFNKKFFFIIFNHIQKKLRKS